jgi:hypothetical protein
VVGLVILSNHPELQMENSKLINKRLRDLYGIHPETGKPFFRLVWSEDLIEKRFVEENHRFSESGIWLGIDRNSVVETKKYNYLKDRWILEVYDPAQILNPEIRGGDGYEPLFVFQKDGQYLRPEWFAIEYCVKRWQWAKSGLVPTRTEKMDALEDQEDLDKETAKFMDYLSSESSDLMNKFRYQEAVLIHKGE